MFVLFFFAFALVCGKCHGDPIRVGGVVDNPPAAGGDQPPAYSPAYSAVAPHISGALPPYTSNEWPGVVIPNAAARSVITKAPTAVITNAAVTTNDWSSLYEGAAARMSKGKMPEKGTKARVGASLGISKLKKGVVYNGVVDTKDVKPFLELLAKQPKLLGRTMIIADFKSGRYMRFANEDYCQALPDRNGWMFFREKPEYGCMTLNVTLDVPRNKDDKQLPLKDDTVVVTYNTKESKKEILAEHYTPVVYKETTGTVRKTVFYVFVVVKTGKDHPEAYSSLTPWRTPYASYSVSPVYAELPECFLEFDSVAHQRKELDIPEDEVAKLKGAIYSVKDHKKGDSEFGKDLLGIPGKLRVGGLRWDAIWAKDDEHTQTIKDLIPLLKKGPFKLLQRDVIVMDLANWKFYRFAANCAPYAENDTWKFVNTTPKSCFTTDGNFANHLPKGKENDRIIVSCKDQGVVKHFLPVFHRVDVKRSKRDIEFRTFDFTRRRNSEIKTSNAEHYAEYDQLPECFLEFYWSPEEREKDSKVKAVRVEVGQRRQHAAAPVVGATSTPPVGHPDELKKSISTYFVSSKTSKVHRPQIKLSEKFDVSAQYEVLRLSLKNLTNNEGFNAMIPLSNLLLNAYRHLLYRDVILLDVKNWKLYRFAANCSPLTRGDGWSFLPTEPRACMTDKVGFNSVGDSKGDIIVSCEDKGVMNHYKPDELQLKPPTKSGVREYIIFDFSKRKPVMVDREPAVASSLSSYNDGLPECFLEFDASLRARERRARELRFTELIAWQRRAQEHEAHTKALEAMQHP